MAGMAPSAKIAQFVQHLLDCPFEELTGQRIQVALTLLWPLQRSSRALSGTKSEDNRIQSEIRDKLKGLGERLAASVADGKWCLRWSCLIKDVLEFNGKTHHVFGT